MAQQEPINDSGVANTTAYVGDILSLLEQTNLDGSSLGNEAATLPTVEAVNRTDYRARTDKTATHFITDRSLTEKYNRHIYTSPSIDQTYFKIGPLTYGGEVQDIQILEQKAVQQVASSRGGKDFLVDSGEGSADVRVSLLFSGKQHVIDGLIPLVALMKISPITSIKNNVIDTALYNKFTENSTPTTDAIAIDRVDKVLALAVKLQEYTKLLTAIGVEGHDVPTPDQFEQAKNYPVCYDAVQGKTYEEWLASLEDQQFFTPDPIDNYNRTLTDSPLGNLDRSRSPLSHLDKTGHVPMAFIGLDVTTHPELTDSLIVTISLKRIGVQNFLRDYLQYRTIDNLPTPDARKAFWLNRAIDLYIDKYYYDAQSYLNVDFGKITLSYTGDDLVLNFFKDSHNLKDIELNDNPSKQEGTTVVQLQYSITNKFAFHRLAGESYPTAQHMGTSSGSMSLGIRTNNLTKFEQLHTFKSAADFFVRSSDRLDRFNGWRIDCILTRLFNSKEYPTSQRDDTIAGAKLFYPDAVVTATVGEYPGLRDVNFSLIETSPDFFSEFGFVLLTNGLTIELLHKFYRRLVENLDPNDFAYNHFIFYGSGDGQEKFSLLNPDTIVAAFVEKNILQGFDETDNNAMFVDDSGDGTAALILKEFEEDPKLGGKLDTQKTGIGLIIEELPNPFTVFGQVPMSDITARLTASANFYFPDTTDQIYQELVNKIKYSYYPDGRRALYEYLFVHLNAGDIKPTERFLEHLFTAIVKRAQQPLTDRLYDRANVANAYNSLEAALATKPEEIAGTDQDLIDNFNRSKAVNNAMVFNADGSIDIAQRRITSYPDYLYVTFKDFFSLPEIGIDNWKRYAYTYQDLGIINPNPTDYSEDKTASLTSDLVTQAQLAIVTTATSPIPPSIYFYRERELEELRLNLDSQYQQWLDSLNIHRIDIPYDIEFLLKEEGKITGERGVLDEDGNVRPISTFSEQEDVGLATLIERMNARSKNRVGFDGQVKTAGEEAVALQWKKAKADLGYGSRTDIEFKAYIDKLRKDSPTSPELARFNRFLKGDKFEAFVPIIYTSHRGKDVARYRKIAGTVGSATYKDVVQRAAKVANQSPEDFTGDVIANSAAGLDDGISITHSSYEESHNAALKATMALADNRNDIIKAFPVFRLYLIDYNKGDRIFVKDNFYGWNAIESIDITLDKNDAELAVIRIADPMHILQGSIFEDKLTWNNGVIDNFTLPNTESDANNNFLDRFELKQGRAIQIRGGYSSDPDNLDILFTGRIAEVQFGDLVVIVAQGWKAELLSKQVDFELTSVENSSVKDLVIRTIRDSNPAGFGNAYTSEELEQILRLSTKTTLDGAIIRAIQNQFGTFGGESGYSGTEGFVGHLIFGGKNQGLDMRLKNIWTPDNDKTRFNYFADITTTGWEGEYWLIPMQPAWDVLQQATNYIWGYVCQSVPYDGESTLFFGRPEQLYYFTRGNPRSDTAYQKAQLREAKTYKGTVIDLFNDFINGSRFYNGGSLYQDSRYSRLFDQPSDGLTQPVTVLRFTSLFDNNAQQVTYQPDQFSLLGYLNLNKSALLDSDIQDDTIPIPFLTSNLRRDFYTKDFTDLAKAVGGENNAAFFLFCSFYGFSEEYVNSNFFPASDTVRTLLLPQDSRSLNSIKLRILDSLDSGSKLAQTGRTVRLNLVSKAVAQTNLSRLGTVTPDIFKYFVPSKGIFNGGGFGDYNITYTGSYSQYPRETIVAYLEALGTYIQAQPTMEAAIGPMESTPVTHTIRDVSVTARTGVPILNITIDAQNIFTLRHDEFIDAAFQNPGLVNIINNKARQFFEKSKEVDENIPTLIDSIFDTEFRDMSTQLHCVNPLEQSIEDINGQIISDYIVNNVFMFRAYCFFFSQYIKSLEEPDANAKQKEHLTSVKNTNHFKFPPALNMKPFRDYHYIASGVEIIQNNISASTREMFNTVVVRGMKKITTSNDAWYKNRHLQGDYDTVTVEDITWQTWPNEQEEGHIGYQFNDSLSLENKKIGVYTDINVTRRDQAAKVSTNVMAKYLRPMYRNNLLIMGRAIKPWDQIHLDDKYNDMLGPLEVERVIHHYSCARGWVTNIVPHAVVEANPGNSAVQRAVFANKIDNIYNAVDVALWGITIATAIPTLGASIGLASSAGRWAGAKSLQAVLAPSFARLEKQGLREWATKFSSNAMVSERFKLLKTAVVTNTPTTVRSFFRTTTASYALGEISRAFYLNSMAGNMQSPVSIQPVLFKGIPFEAGLNGRDTVYFSLTSKLHWTFQDLKEGLEQVSHIVTDVLSRPSPTVAEHNLRAMGLPQGR